MTEGVTFEIARNSSRFRLTSSSKSRIPYSEFSKMLMVRSVSPRYSRLATGSPRRTPSAIARRASPEITIEPATWFFDNEIMILFCPKGRGQSFSPRFFPHGDGTGLETDQRNHRFDTDPIQGRLPSRQETSFRSHLAENSSAGPAAGKHDLCRSPPGVLKIAPIMCENRQCAKIGVRLEPFCSSSQSVGQ